MTYADNYNIRTTSVKFNDVADALDGLITRNYAGLTTGTSTAYIATPTPAWDAYTTSGLVVIIPHVSNSGAATLNISSLGVRDLRIGGNAIAAGVLQQSVPAILAYTGTYFEVLLQSVSIPAGTIYTYAGASTPTGYLLCDGTAYNTYTYRTLHAAISNIYGGTAYSAGTTDQPAAVTTFLVPDLRRRTPVGRGASDTLGFTESANNTGLAYASRSRQHSHNIEGHYHTVGTGSALTAAGQSLGTTDVTSNSAESGHSHGHSLTADSNGDHNHWSMSSASGNTRGNPGLQFATTNTTIYGAVTGGQTFAGTTTSINGAHVHSVSGTVGGTDGTHTHKTNIAHTHAASSVTGNIGKVTGGQNGDAGFASQAAGDPFLFVNFIIKT